MRFQRVWIVKGREFTSKQAAYRSCRTANGKKSGGKRNFTVQRKLAG